MAAPPDPRKVIASVQQQLGTAFLPGLCSFPPFPRISSFQPSSRPTRPQRTYNGALRVRERVQLRSRNFLGLQNALEVYARSIRSLAESGRGCQPPGRIHAEKLHVFSGKLKEVIDKHRQCVGVYRSWQTLVGDKVWRIRPQNEHIQRRGKGQNQRAERWFSKARKGHLESEEAGQPSE